MAVVPFFNMNKIRATMKENEHFIDEAENCYRKGDLAGAVHKHFAYYKPLGGFPFANPEMKSSSGFWSLCSSAVARYGNDAAYAMIFNPDWNDTDPGDPDVSAWSRFLADIRKENETVHIEKHYLESEFSDMAWQSEPTAWTTNAAGLWMDDQAGNELMKTVDLFEAENAVGENCGKPLFIKTGPIREMLTINSASEIERTKCYGFFWSEAYGSCRLMTDPAEAVRQGWFKMEMPRPGGKFTVACANELIIATIKDYLEGGVAKQNENRGSVQVVDEATAEDIYRRYSIPRLKLAFKETMESVRGMGVTYPDAGDLPFMGASGTPPPDDPIFHGGVIISGRDSVCREYNERERVYKNVPDNREFREKLKIRLHDKWGVSDKEFEEIEDEQWDVIKIVENFIYYCRGRVYDNTLACECYLGFYKSNMKDGKRIS